VKQMCFHCTTLKEHKFALKCNLHICSSFMSNKSVNGNTNENGGFRCTTVDNVFLEVVKGMIDPTSLY